MMVPLNMCIIAVLASLAYVNGFKAGRNFDGRFSSRETSQNLNKGALMASVQYLDQALLLQGPVANGYGRGSKKLGVPTANLPYFDKEVTESALTNGVYFGWGYLPKDREILGCVANIGKSPTFVNQENPVNIIEAHLLDRSVNSDSDFYGSALRLCLIGFIRPEQKFSSFDALITQINADIQLGRDLTMSFDSEGPLGAGRAIATKFFESPFNNDDNASFVWNRVPFNSSRK